MAAQGWGCWDLGRVRSVFGLLDNPCFADGAGNIWAGEGGKGDVWPENQIKSQVQSVLIVVCFFSLGTAAEKPGQHRVPAAQD